MYYVHISDKGLVEVSTGLGEKFVSLAWSKVAVTQETGVSDYVIKEIESYNGVFDNLNASTKTLFLDNTLRDFNKGKR